MPANLVEDRSGKLVVRHAGHPGVPVFVRKLRPDLTFDTTATTDDAHVAKTRGAVTERADGALNLTDGWTLHLDPIGLDVR